jgi:nucleotide-binding universal stress UspA family protein
VTAATQRGIFRDIVAGIDGSPEADTALQLAGWMRADLARMLGFSVGAGAGEGRPVDALLAAARRCHADLIAVGERHAHRIARDSPCSVLIGRGVDPDAFPRAIVVGVDGSAHAADAEAVGHVLADSFGAQLRRVEETDAEPTAALVEASRDADLLIIGSRGVHGSAVLGSVAEAVAEGAACSVLVVRLR